MKSDADWVVKDHNGNDIAYFMYAIDAALFLSFMTVGSAIFCYGRSVFVLSEESRAHLNSMSFAFDKDRHKWFQETATKLVDWRAEFSEKADAAIWAKAAARMSGR